MAENVFTPNPADWGPLDIVFVGAGWGGLAGATRALQHTREGRPLRIAIIEAGTPGKRMASRNNAGFLAPDFAHALPDYAKELCEKRVAEGASLLEAEADILPKIKDYMGLTLAACAGFFEFADVHGVVLHRGPMFLQRTPSTAKKIAEQIKTLNEKFGLAPLTQLSRKEVRTLLQTGKKVYAGGWVYEMGGYFDPPPVYDAILRSLQEQGVPVLHECKAKSVQRDGDGLLRLETSKGEIKTRYVVMTSAYSHKINPDALSRIMFYAPHAYVADSWRTRLAPQGVWAFEDSGRPSYYANSTGRHLYYGAADTLADTPWDDAYARRFSNTSTLEIWNGWKDIFHEISGREHKTARLATTSTGFPEIAHEWDGQVITSGGHDDRGIGTSAHAARVITDGIARRLHGYDNAVSMAHEKLFRELPHGRAMNDAEKADYLKVHLPNLQRVQKRHAKLGTVDFG